MICKMQNKVFSRSNKEPPKLMEYILRRTRNLSEQLSLPLELGNPELLEMIQAMNGNGVYCPRCFFVITEGDIFGDIFGDMARRIGTRCPVCESSPYQTNYSCDVMIPGEGLLRQIGVFRAETIWKNNLLES